VSAPSGNPLSGRHKLEALAAWEKLADERDYAWAIALPGFPCAAAQLAANMLEVAARDRTIDSVFKDAGRYVTAMFAFHLHVGGGLTVPRLKAMCTRSGLLSPGRVTALVRHLEHLGYLERQSAYHPSTYVPTPAFREAWRLQLAAALAAAIVIEPRASVLLERLGDTAIMETFMAAHSSGLLSSTAGGLPEQAALIHTFLHPYAGNQILASMIASADGPFPPAIAGPVSMSGYAARFGVSRMHVRRIFDEAERAGLARLGPDGMVAFAPAAREQMAFSYAGQLVHILAAATRTIRVCLT
jgi:hypothetical protein